MVGPRSGALEEEGGASSPLTTTTTTTKKKNKWAKMMPLLVAIVVVAEIAFLGRLDLAKNAAVVNSWTGYFHQHSTSSLPEPGLSDDEQGLGLGLGVGRPYPRSSSRADDGCEEWLERVDAVEYSRDFEADPILVSGGEEQEWKTCAVGCKFGYKPLKKPDAAFGHPQDSQTAGVIRSMESAHYYSENNLDQARRNGYNIVMTTSLSSDVPVGYFSWAEYDIMAPLQPKTEKALAAAFISNCGARNFRLEALEALERAKISIDSYGGCHRNRGGNVDKVSTLKRYKFSLAFENSNEEDYVTEKFFQSLVAGSIPVVIGAPNILEFAPSRKSILHIKELKDADEVAKTMKYLSENSLAYNESLRWKYEGPSDSFKALVDMAAVHSSCRLCIHLATGIREQEERSLGSRKRPCKCTRGSETVHHLYVRERGRFHMVSIFLRGGNLTLEALESAVLKKFRSLKHVPIWKQERPESIRGDDKLKVYKVYPLGLTQRKALYNFKFQDDFDFRNHLESNPCAKFEVIFV